MTNGTNKLVSLIPALSYPMEDGEFFQRWARMRAPVIFIV
jgi:hypothetical protein